MRDTFRMVVRKYIPQRLYGFVHNSSGEGFFHLGYFHCPFAGPEEAPVPPLVGEDVDVVFADGKSPSQGGTAPRASRVTRVQPPIHTHGVVEAFDSRKGFGFIKRGDGASFYLHRSEVKDGRIPLVGDKVAFYIGHSRGRPRACYVEVLGREG